MRTNEAGVALIKSFESCCLKAYPDPKTGDSPWTCGWGATGHDIDSETEWTQDEADARLVADIERTEALVDRALTHDLDDNQYSALVSLVFNVGPGSANRDGILRLKSGLPSTLMRGINAGDFGKAEGEWCKWISPGSSVAHGLLRRRQAELALFRGETA